MVVGLFGDQVTRSVANAIVFDAERDRTFRMSHKYIFHRMIPVRVKTQINARNGLGLRPLQNQFGRIVIPIGDPGVRLICRSRDSIRDIGWSKHSQRRINRQRQVASAGTSFWTPELERFDADVFQRFLCAEIPHGWVLAIRNRQNARETVLAALHRDMLVSHQAVEKVARRLNGHIEIRSHILFIAGLERNCLAPKDHIRRVIVRVIARAEFELQGRRLSDVDNKGHLRRAPRVNRQHLRPRLRQWDKGTIRRQP